MTNTGLLTVDTPTSDSDITIPEVADAFEDFARNWFDGRGELLCRFGNAPRRAFPFRTLKPFRKITANYKAPDGTFHKIEFLGDGQQIVVDGTHPDTKKPYEWARGRSPLTTPWQNLPEIDEAEVHAFLEAAGKMLHERFGFEPAAPVNNGHIVAGAPVNIEQRLKDMVYRGPEDRSIHQTQLQCIGALLRNNTRLDDAVAMVLEATRQAVANDPSWNWQEEEHNLIRMGFDLITKAPELAPCLNDKHYEMWQAATARCGPGERVSTSINRWGPIFRTTTRDAATAVAHPTPPENAPVKPARVVLQPFKIIDPHTLAPREYLYGRQFQRRTVSATVAPGGTGKTSLVSVEALAMCTARNLLGEQPEVRCRVWIHNGEDSRAELDRRILAICQYYKIPQEELVGWLFLTSGTEMPLKVANGYSELKVDTPLIEEMTRTVLEQQIDVIILDPLVTIHSVSENDNGRMDAVVRIFSRMADVCDCAIDLSQHTRKLASGVLEHTADDARGASSVHDAVRAQRILNVMSAKEAEANGIDEMKRRSYFRVDRSKNNTAPPAKIATWRHFENVMLPNGDEVGVVTPCAIGEGAPSPERESAAQKAKDIYLQLLDRFTHDGRIVNEKSGKHYAPSVFALELEAKKARIGKIQLEEAQRQLFADYYIRVEDCGRPGRPVSRIVRIL